MIFETVGLWGPKQLLCLETVGSFLKMEKKIYNSRPKGKQVAFNAWFPKHVLTFNKTPSQKKTKVKDSGGASKVMDHQPVRMQVQQVQAVGYHTAICKDASLKKGSWKSICKCMRQEIRVFNSWSIKIHFGPVTPFKSSCAFWWRTSGAEKDLTDLARTKFQYFWRHVKTNCPKTQGTSSRLWLRSLWGLVPISSAQV